MKSIKAAFIVFVVFQQTLGSVLSTSCTPIDDCSCKMDNGKEISLHQIDKRNSILFPEIPDGVFKVSYNPCTPFSKDDNCHDVLVCQYKEGSPSETFPLATPRSTIFSVEDGNVFFTYSALLNGLKRTISILLVCDPTANIPKTSSVTEAPTTNFRMELTHKCACPGACSSDSPASDSNKNLSVGSILCILLLVFSVVYLVAGILFLKYHKKEEGSDVVPNKEFWMDFPSKVKDGFKFTYSKIKGNGEYETI